MESSKGTQTTYAENHDLHEYPLIDSKPLEGQHLADFIDRAQFHRGALSRIHQSVSATLTNLARMTRTKKMR
jgi:hypothetical protein